MSDWPTDDNGWPDAVVSTGDGTGAGNGARLGEGGQHPRPLGDAGTAPSPVETPAIPDFMRKAMEAAHVDVAAVLAAAVDEHVIPSDEEAAFVQAARRESGMRCNGCQRPVKPDDPNMLREITGWSRPREQGGQNHVIDRRETGGLLCGACGLRLQHGLAPQQETLV